MTTQSQDRITELPHHIRQQMISLLPPYGALATAVLSRQWRDVWITFPHLPLGGDLYGPVFVKYANTELRNQVPNRFLDFVDRTLTIRSSTSYVLKRIDLYIPWSNVLLREQVYPYLNRWLDFVADHNHQLSHLTFRDEHFEPLKFSNKAFIGAYALKRISLTGSKLDSDIIECLATHCPLLESICFDHCFRQDILKVSGLLNMIELVVREPHNYEHDRIEIHHAPNLLHFDYKRIYSHYLPEEDCKISLDGCESLKSLRICHGVFLGGGNQAILSKLEHLELQCSLVPNTHGLVISSHCLKSLHLGFGFNLSLVKVDAPNLKEFAYTGGLDDLTLELKFTALQKAIVRPTHGLNEVQLVDFVAKLQPCETLEIQFGKYIFRGEDLLFTRNWQAKTSRGFNNVKHLMLTHLVNFDTNWWPGLWKTVYSAFWLCPYPETISMSIIYVVGKEEAPTLPPPDHIKVLKFKYDEDEGCGLNCNRCKVRSNPYWKHHVKEVTIENIKEHYGFEEDSESDDMIIALFDNAIMGKRLSLKGHYLNYVGLRN